MCDVVDFAKKREFDSWEVIGKIMRNRGIYQIEESLLTKCRQQGST